MSAGIRAAGHRNAVLHAHISGQGALQLLHFGAEDVTAVVQHRGDARIHGLTDGATIR